VNIRFEKATSKHQKAIFQWLEEPYVKEFWDNSQEHKSDILNFINGRKEPSSYADGLYIYWVGLLAEKPYSLIMTIEEKLGATCPQIKNDHLSRTGTTYSLDYMIGDSNYFGKGLGAKTLETFIEFFYKEFDARADTFFIDPDVTNTRAKHVYEKVGFEYMGNFIMEGDGVFAGLETFFLVKKLKINSDMVTAKPIN
jgi:RimJ/RimL family protein N-acetyltransferase